MSAIRDYFDYNDLIGRYKPHLGIVIKAEPSPIGENFVRVIFDNKSFTELHINHIEKYFRRNELMRWEKEKILNSDYSKIIKNINYTIKLFEYKFSGFPERPLVAIRQINELIKAVINKSKVPSAKLEYKKSEFRLTKIAFIEFSLAEELEFRYWREEKIRHISFAKILRYLLWLLIPNKVAHHELSKFRAWGEILSILNTHSDFFTFKMDDKISEYETLIINWRYYETH